MTMKTQRNLISFLMETIKNPDEYEKVTLELSRITNGIKTYEDLVRVANLDFENIKISEESKRLLKEAISKNQLEDTKSKTANTNKFMKIYQYKYQMEYHSWTSKMFFQYLVSKQVSSKDAFFLSTDIDSIHFVNGYSEDEIKEFEHYQSIIENKTEIEITNETEKENNENDIENTEKIKEENQLNEEQIKRYNQYMKWKSNNGYSQYETIKKEIKKEYAVMILTRAARKQKQMQKEQLLKQRTHVIEEICVTERNYVEQLRTVIEYILKPVKQNKMIKEELIPRLFGDIILIHNVNKQFSQLLDSFKIENYNHLLIGKLFNTMSSLFNIYREYGVNYRETAKEIIKMTKEQHPFIDWSKKQIEQNAIEAYNKLDRNRP